MAGVFVAVRRRRACDLRMTLLLLFLPVPMVEKASGVILIILGLLLATGQLTILSQYLTTFTPDWVLNRI